MKVLASDYEITSRSVLSHAYEPSMDMKRILFYRLRLRYVAPKLILTVGKSWKCGSPNNLVGLVTRLQAGQPRNWGSVQGSGRRFITSPHR
jgi:hypothetical protein